MGGLYVAQAEQKNHPPKRLPIFIGLLQKIFLLEQEFMLVG